MEFIDLVERLLKASAGMSQALALLHFIGAGPADIGKKFAKKMDWFKYLLDNTREEFRETIAAVYGLVSASLSEQEFDMAVTDLTRYIFGRCLNSPLNLLISLLNFQSKFLTISPLRLTNSPLI